MLKRTHAEHSITHMTRIVFKSGRGDTALPGVGFGFSVKNTSVRAQFGGVVVVGGPPSVVRAKLETLERDWSGNPRARRVIG